MEQALNVRIKFFFCVEFFQITRQLDVEGLHGVDYLSEKLLNYTNSDILLIRQSGRSGGYSVFDGPTRYVLQEWSTKPNTSLRHFLETLQDIGRHDVHNEIVHFVIEKMRTDQTFNRLIKDWCCNESLLHEPIKSSQPAVMEHDERSVCVNVEGHSSETLQGVCFEDNLNNIPSDICVQLKDHQLTERQTQKSHPHTKEHDNDPGETPPMVAMSSITEVWRKNLNNLKGQERVCVLCEMLTFCFNQLLDLIHSYLRSGYVGPIDPSPWSLLFHLFSLCKELLFPGMMLFSMYLVLMSPQFVTVHLLLFVLLLVQISENKLVSPHVHHMRREYHIYYRLSCKLRRHTESLAARSRVEEHQSLIRLQLRLFIVVELSMCGLSAFQLYLSHGMEDRSTLMCIHTVVLLLACLETLATVAIYVCHYWRVDVKLLQGRFVLAARVQHRSV